MIGGGLGVRFGQPMADRIFEAMQPHLFRDDRAPGRSMSLDSATSAERSARRCWRVSGAHLAAPRRGAETAETTFLSDSGTRCRQLWQDSRSFGRADSGIEEETLSASTAGSATPIANTGPGRGGRRVPRPSGGVAARLGAAGALLVAVIVIAVLVLGSNSSYTVRARFQNASGLVTGNNVLIGTAAVGTVASIGLTPNGLAEVTLHLHGVGHAASGDGRADLRGLVVGHRQPSTSSSNRDRASQPAIRSGGTIGVGSTHSEVSLDELFNSLDAKTRGGLSNLIRGEAASLRNGGKAANQTLKYLAPGLASASQVTKELTRDEPSFDGLLVQGAKAMQALASKSSELSELMSNTSQAAGAIARQSQALQQSLDAAATVAEPVDDDVRGPGLDARLAGRRWSTPRSPRSTAAAVPCRAATATQRRRCRRWRSSTTLIHNPAAAAT